MEAHVTYRYLPKLDSAGVVNDTAPERKTTSMNNDLVR